ncbi:MAG: acyl-CoA dehydrogenase family protein, partial [Proteobacteria bacterium]|nr:acyl-CoA dehydrogenase family protein [Pseudomonadota bacterium]
MSTLRADDAATPVLMDNLIPACEQALDAADTLTRAIKSAVAALMVRDGRVDRKLLEANQSIAHGYGWTATYVEALRQTLAWAKRLDSEGRHGELEALILQAGFGEYCAQLLGGLPMSQVEWARPAELGASDDEIAAFAGNASVKTLMRGGNTEAVRGRIAALIADSLGSGNFGDTGLDETYQMIRDQFRRFAEEEVIPDAHEWHLQDKLIPDNVVQQMSDLGVFGLTIPEEYGGAGMSKMSMCVVSEELSRGYIGVGSLGTRSEIAAELILNGGTEEQKRQWLPKLAAGEILPTAVFTEPNV